MSKHGISRIVAILGGAAVLFVLQQEFGLQLYLAIPAGMVAYFAILVAMGLALGVNPRAKGESVRGEVRLGPPRHSKGRARLL